MKRVVNSNLEIRTVIAKKIIKLLPRYCKEFSLVVRDGMDLTNTGIAFLQLLDAHKIRSERTSHWPGTKLLEGQATVHYYKLNDETALHLDSVGSLLQFVAPDYPEDICFYDHDSEPWMITISHEHDLYFSIEEDEIHFLESIFGKNNFYLN